MFNVIQGIITKNNGNIQDDLKLINRYTRRELLSDEVYTFNVTLCDNEIDRDFESFTPDALHKLAELFLGKTGIFDHNPKGHNQTARIYFTEVICQPNQNTQFGDPYYALKAKAYMVKSDKNADMILDIDAGIKKEVSVGCNMGQITCSICGADLKKVVCEHKKGMLYNNQMCFGMLSDPIDAYEWSFVAVPAQRNAGVTKKFDKKSNSFQEHNSDFIENCTKKGESFLSNRNYEELVKAFSTTENEVILSKSEAHKLYEHLESLKSNADLGIAYVATLKEKVLKMGFLCGELVEHSILSSVVEKMSVQELLAYQNAYEKLLAQKMPSNGQLGNDMNSNKAFTNNQFKI